jgi:histidinol-phosphate aminotransferase
MIDFNINNLVRENIIKLKPYQSARDELKDKNSILLDANENPFPSDYNRYPDPLQRELKTEITNQKGISANNIFLGNGSDEIIDLLIRAFCNPRQDSILINVPTYGMYGVCANINDIKVIKIELDKNFQIDLKSVYAKTANTKIIFICSPNNPTGNIILKDDIVNLLENFSGLVVIDEAYIDFATEASFLNEVSNYPNLVILQTFSKARAMAGIRLGMAFANSQIIEILNKIKYPYNISQLNQQAALKSLQNNKSKDEVDAIIKQKENLIKDLEILKTVKKIWPSDANFLLVEFQFYKEIFDFLRNKGIIIRDRSNEPNCSGCLRITIGTPNENAMLIKNLNQFEQIKLKTYEKDIIS